MKTLIISFLSLILTSITAFADNSTSGFNSNNSGPVYIVSCPQINQLVKDEQAMTWSAPGGWQSYQKSFAEKINQLEGAQWAGIKVGQIICIYSAVEKGSFQIQLLYKKLVIEPSGGTWGENKGGYINCPSHNSQDCRFQLKVANPSTDIIQDALNIKQATHN